MVAPLVYIGAAIAGKLVYDLNTGSNTDEQTANAPSEKMQMHKFWYNRKESIWKKD